MLSFCSFSIHVQILATDIIKFNHLIFICFNFAIFLRWFFVPLEPHGLDEDIIKQHTGLSTESVGNVNVTNGCRVAANSSARPIEN